MKLLAFSVYDEKVQAFMAPFFAPSMGHAARSFEDTVNGGQSLVSKHPADFSLYQVGSFEDVSAELVSTVPAVLVGRGPDFLEAKGRVADLERKVR